MDNTLVGLICTLIGLAVGFAISKFLVARADGKKKSTTQVELDLMIKEATATAENIKKERKKIYFLNNLRVLNHKDLGQEIIEDDINKKNPALMQGFLFSKIKEYFYQNIYKRST